MTRHRTLPVIACLAVLLSGCSGVRFVIDAVPSDDQLAETVVLEDARSGPAKIALLDVRGLISDGRRAQIVGQGENPVSTFIEALEKAAEDRHVKALIVRINSPGGTVAASEVMYRELQHFKRETGKPVVVSMADVAASGGYYLACAADEILALPSTVTGSIGVIIQTINVADGLGRIGVRADAITSGDNKSMGSPFHPMTDEHRALLQGIVDEFYASFRAVVTSNRPDLPESDVDWITDGRVFTGSRAAEIGLVDRIGDLRDAFDAAKSRAGLDSAKLVKYHHPVRYVGSAYARTGVADVSLVELNLGLGQGVDQPGFYYLWVP